MVLKHLPKTIFPTILNILMLSNITAFAADSWNPYDAPRTERKEVFAFTQKPVVVYRGDDKYEISFSVKDFCDVTVGIVDEKGKVARHLASGVLGSNAPDPFQKSALKQTIFWDGKDDLEVYHKEPENLRVRVRLGLKPTFDKLLGGASPHNLPGYPVGITASSEGVFVYVRGVNARGHCTIRQFDHKGNYTKTVFPPPANLPPNKLGGLWNVEHESGKRSILGAECKSDTYARSNWFPAGLGYGGPATLGMATFGDRLFFSSTGYTPGKPKEFYPALHWVHTDGSTDFRGITGRIYYKGRGHSMDPKLAVSPDGKQVYMVGLEGKNLNSTRPVVLRFTTDEKKHAEVFAGDLKKPGSDKQHLNGACDVACDAAGRVYVADRFNNRIQIFSAEGKHLKEIKARTPHAVRVHQKTGDVYVLQIIGASKTNRGAVRISKFKSFPDLSEEFHQDGLAGGPTGNLHTGPIFALDSWSSTPRIWIGWARGHLPTQIVQANLQVWEESKSTWNKILDFNKRAAKDSGKGYHGPWLGSTYDHVHCDPLREVVYFRRDYILDIKSGTYLGRVPEKRAANPLTFTHGGAPSDLIFDKRGYLHLEYGYSHLARVNPDRLPKTNEKLKWNLAEVPYDYGIQKPGWKGALHLSRVGRHPCGMGVNMRGDVADVLNVEIVPKMDDLVKGYNALVYGRYNAFGHSGASWMTNLHGKFMKSAKEMEKQGTTLWAVKRRPGIPLGGGTIWTWDRSGELRHEGAVIAGHRVNGVRIDEDGSLYFSNTRLRLIAGKPFLSNRAGHFGAEEAKTMFTGTYMKTRGAKVLFRALKGAPVPMDQKPARPADIYGSCMSTGKATDIWVDGAEWLYAGASPMKPSACMCPQIRVHLDWFKRSYVPELYRHSIGILDTAGNVILHLGKYGNFDSGTGPNSKVKVGGDEIASTAIRHLSGTDDYLIYSDWAQRLTVLKLNYHASAITSIPVKKKPSLDK